MKSDASQDQEPKGWYSRGYLPHFDAFDVNQFVTIRLHDSVPVKVIAQWQDELRYVPEEKRRIQLIRMIEKYLDMGHGSSYLAEPSIARIVADSLQFWDGVKYKLQAYVIMPNHAHLLLKPFEGEHLFKVVQSLKKYTSRLANEALGKTGHFWYREYFDRYMRDEQHFARTVDYIHQNPVKAKLCATASDWEFSSAARTLNQIQADADLEISGPGE